MSFALRLLRADSCVHRHYVRMCHHVIIGIFLRLSRVDGCVDIAYSKTSSHTFCASLQSCVCMHGLKVVYVE